MLQSMQVQSIAHILSEMPTVTGKNAQLLGRLTSYREVAFSVTGSFCFSHFPVTGNVAKFLKINYEENVVQERKLTLCICHCNITLLENTTW